jgi:fluoroacetyl-CoA thioesterase
MNSAIKITVGAEAGATTVVTKELTVCHFHSNMPEVYATPCMIHLMEIAASNAVQPYLPGGSLLASTSIYVTWRLRQLAAPLPHMLELPKSRTS